MREIVSPLDGIRSPFRTARGRFSPLALFAASEPGGWYDPSDLTTLFQDAAGTTPVSAVEQPVGLVLDKSKGLTLGSERISNGTFDTDLTGWIIDNSSGTARQVTRTVSGARIQNDGSGNITFRQTSVFEANKSYRVAFTATVASGSLDVRRGLSNIVALSSSGSFSYIVGGASLDAIIFTSSVACDVTVDNISVRELPGSHLSQSTSTARPVLSARVNLLTRTEALSDAVWTNGPISSGTRTNGAVSISSSEGYCYIRQAGTFDTAIDYTMSFEVTCDQTVANVPLRTGSGSTNPSALVSFTANVAQRVTLTGYKPPAAYIDLGIDARNAVVPGGSDATGYTLTFNKIDLRPANAGVGLPAYQRVGAATDYDTTGFPLYLKFDGTDDSLASGSIDFTSTDKMSVFAGVRKLSDATGYGVLVENTIGTAGSFTIHIPFDTATASYNFTGGNTTRRTATVATGYSAPITNILTGLGNISGDSNILRVNGTQVAQATGDQGTGNYNNTPLYVGAREGTSLRFNGHLYSLIIRGALTDAATIASTETWVNQKTLAY